MPLKKHKCEKCGADWWCGTPNTCQLSLATPDCPECVKAMPQFRQGPPVTGQSTWKPEP